MNPAEVPVLLNPVLNAFNAAAAEEARRALLSCCASRRWAEGMLQARPFAHEDALYRAADQIWSTMQEPDWMEAFAAHPRIGERKPAQASEQSRAWSSQEQAQVHAAQDAVLAELAEGNRTYEQKFGLTYIVCATGKPAEEMLAILQRRLSNDREAELAEAAEQQRQITQIRLRKWLEA